MAAGLRFSYWWLLVCWLVGTVAEGQEGVTPPGGSQNNANPTDCQIFTLTPPPTTRRPVSRVQPPITRAPTYTFPGFPQGRPRVHPRVPGRPFLPPNCSHRFRFWPFYWPYGRPAPGRYVPGRRLRTRSSSSSEESREEGEVQAH